MICRRIFALFCLIMAFVFCAPVQGLAANPIEYERAKVQLEKLQKRKASAKEWLNCAESFRKVYNGNPRWRLRVAALYRCGMALEGRARVTRSAEHARKAAAVYEQAAKAHATAALADDALFRAAVVRNELLRDKNKARAHLQTIVKRYAKTDHAAPAKRYLAALEGPSKKVSAAKAAQEKKVRAANAKAQSKATKAGPPSEKKAAPKAAPASVQKKPQTGKEKTPANKTAPVKPAPRKEVQSSSSKKQKPIAQDLAAQLGLSVRTVVIDAGHGGRDPGTSHNGVVERDINLDVAKRIRTTLEKRGYKVCLTRDRDKWLSLGERVRLGKNFKGDLFVSIHVNAAESSSAVGFETYILDFARTSSAARLAVIENANSGRLGDMDKVLGEIVRGVRTAESRRLADCIQTGTLSHLKKNGKRIHDGGVKGAPFHVLAGSTMPSVLVEVGYCTNKAEARRLLDPKYRQSLAQGIANGVHSYARRLSGR